jgi:hypothetical protein
MTTGPEPGPNVAPAAAGQGAHSTQGKPGCLRPMLLAIAGLAVLCGVGCLVVALGVAPSLASRAPAGLPITVCAGVAVQPRFQAGVVWVSPISSYLPPVAASRYSVCFRLPSSGIPSTPWGEWVFPP